jgi:hypothetical protein
LESKLSAQEKEDIYDVFLRIGNRMNIPELPPTYTAWLPVREAHMQNDLARSSYTDDLFLQYKKHLGSLRYKVLTEAQVLVVPKKVSQLLGFKNFSLLFAVVPLYKASRLLKLDGAIKWLLLPSGYKKQIKDLDVVPY